MNTIQIPEAEFNKMQEELALLKNSDMLKKLNRLIDLLFQDKYGLYMGDYTDDLTEHAVNDIESDKNNSVWDNV